MSSRNLFPSTDTRKLTVVIRVVLRFYIKIKKFKNSAWLWKQRNKVGAWQLSLKVTVRILCKRTLVHVTKYSNVTPFLEKIDIVVAVRFQHISLAKPKVIVEKLVFLRVVSWREHEKLDNTRLTSTNRKQKNSVKRWFVMKLKKL